MYIYCNISGVCDISITDLDDDTLPHQILIFLFIVYIVDTYFHSLSYLLILDSRCRDSKSWDSYSLVNIRITYMSARNDRYSGDRKSVV